MKEQILAVQRMQDYIERNRTGEIRLSDLARVSLFSPWYAYRLFRDCLGLTPTEYIRKYRLTQAARQLRGGKTRVIDAARGLFQCGYLHPGLLPGVRAESERLYEKSRSCPVLHSLRCKIS